jgi:glutamate-1-semialdehyde 2,1-aminomutase
MAVLTRIKNNQVTDASAGNVYLGVNAAAKVQDYSITAGKIQNNLTYGSDLTITGNLTVQGNTTTIDTVNLVVEDPLILLAKEQTGSPTLDIGFIGKRGTSDNIAWVWDESANSFVSVFTTSEVTNTTISINSYAAVTTANLTATTGNFSGNVQVANLSTVWTVFYTMPSRYHWMFQFYLRAEGLALSWIGTGRLIFSLNYTEADFEDVAARFVRAAHAMQADGWWWENPGATNRLIRRSLLKEAFWPRSLARK